MRSIKLDFESSIIDDTNFRMKIIGNSILGMMLLLPHLAQGIKIIVRRVELSFEREEDLQQQSEMLDCFKDGGIWKYVQGGFFGS